MNIHHLELFYYVARHGGISQAVRQMPYGIQQPAVSSQILLLEEDLGLKLFDRRPFNLTPTGNELYAFVRPFFENLHAVGQKLRAQSAPALRIGASEIFLRDYLPAVLTSMRRRYPQLRLVLRSGYQEQMQAWLQDGIIDVAVTPLETRPPARLKCLRLVEAPLALLVPARSRIKEAAEFWNRDKVEEPLISLPPTEMIARNFQKGLQRLEVDWPVSIEASSIDLVGRYVANGYGMGVSVHLPKHLRQPGTRLLPLPGFDPVQVAMLWQDDTNPLVRAVIEETERQLRELWPERSS